MGQSGFLTLRRADVCVGCDHQLQVGDHAYWHADRKVVECLGCHPDAATPGASAARIAQKKTERREQSVRERHPHIGGLLLAFQDAPQPEKAWVSGAIGERVVGNTLDSLAARNSLLVLHDRRFPGSRANIDHIAVAPSGIWVIDAKRYQGQLIDTRVRRMHSTLMVGGRPKPQLAEGVIRQARAVKDTVDGVCDVYAVLCFVDAQWPFLGTSFIVHNVRVCPPSRLGKLLGARGPVTEDGIADLGRTLSRNLRAA
ncbi:MAG: nuclease-related domain-containing protein [Acidimicrobiia bacterium]